MTDVAITPRSFRRTPGRHLDLLERAPVTVRTPDLDRHLDETEMQELVAGCDGLIVGVDPVTAAVLDAGPLRVVIKYGSGMDNIDLDAAAERGTTIDDTQGENARSVAELAMGLVLALARHVALHDRRIRAGSWNRETGTELRGKRLGILGYGHVGRELAAIASAFGMEVVAHDPLVDAADVPLLEFEELLRTSDAVSLHVPLTDATAGMIGAPQLELMKPDAFLVNTARGPLVDEAALADALRNERLSAAAFDSFATEPPTESPLVGLERFVSSPHAGASTAEAVERTGLAAVELLLDRLGIDHGDGP